MFGANGSETISRDMNSFLFSSNFKHSSEGEVAKSKEMMTSDLYHNNHQSHNHHYQQLHQQGSGLMRYRSAPSSFFASLLDGSGGSEDFLNPQSSSPESDMIFSKFLSGSNGTAECDSQHLQFPTILKHEESVPQQNDYCGTATQMVYSTPPARDLPNFASLTGGDSMEEGSFSMMRPMAVENLNQVKKSSGNCSNLIRQSSTPAGFLSHVADEIGFGAMNDVGNFRASNGTNVEAGSSTNGPNNHMNFSSGPSSCARLMPQISGHRNENVGIGSPKNGHLVNGNDTNRCYLPSIPDESTFTSLKRNRDGDLKMFATLNGLDSQNGDSRHYTPSLVHHLSLPKTSAEMAAVENYLHFQQDVVPCKIRAKRGFATHPRSIAERVRRTRISERMRKLQELFPNMDKQANTADMLDLAVECIKDLQKEVQTLTDTRARCTCSSKKKQSSPMA